MKRLCVAMSLLVVLVMGFSVSLANIIIDEDFSSNPGWLTKGMTGSPASNFGYNSTQQMIAEAGSSSNPGLFVRHSTWDAYYTDVTEITDANDFVIESKFMITNGNANGGAIYMGLFNNSGNYANEKDSVYFRAIYYNSYSTKAIIRLASGSKIEFGWGALNPNQWYTGRLVYDASSRTAEYFLDGVSKGSVTIGSDQHFTLNMFGVSNDYISSGHIDVNGRVDDMYLNAVPEPATIGLMLAGMVGLLRIRK